MVFKVFIWNIHKLVEQRDILHQFQVDVLRFIAELLAFTGTLPHVVLLNDENILWQNNLIRNLLSYVFFEGKAIKELGAQK